MGKPFTSDPRADDDRPTVQELQGEHPLAQAAKRWWLREKPAKFNPALLKSEIYDVLEKERFGTKALLVLENLQCLEKFLWPNFTDEASNFHVTLIALMVNVKRREDVGIWEHFESDDEKFPVLFRRVLAMCVDETIPLALRSHLVNFIVVAFQSLDAAIVRKECASLVSIAIWNNLSSEEVRNAMLEKYPQTRKVWRASGKRYDAGDEHTQSRLRFERSFLYKMTLMFLNYLYVPVEDTDPAVVVAYCERFIELLTDLESQLPTRRYLNTLLKDMNVLTAIRLSPLYNSRTGLIQELTALLERFVYFSVDDITGDQLSQEDVRKEHNAALAKLQRVAFKHFQDKLTILALANFGSLGEREELAGHLADLDDNELMNLCKILGFRTSYPKSVKLTVDRTFLTEVILCYYERRKTFKDEARELTVLPNEKTLFDESLVGQGAYDGTRPLPIPKINLQYLTVGDFLWRSFILYRHEAFLGIRRNIEEALSQISPRIRYPSMETTFHGFSKMALPISRPSILEVLPPKVGEEKPAAVRAEITLDISKLAIDLKEEWESLRVDDVVFLLGVKGVDDGDKMITNGGTGELSVAEQYGIKCLRSATVVQALDSQGKPLRVGDQQLRASGGRLRLHVNLDNEMYRLDSEAVTNGQPDIYDSINLIIRRRGRENNFRPILESIQELTLSDVPMPEWLQEVFLGFGDPESATNLPNKPEKIDFVDTFTDWAHLVESFSGKKIVPLGETEGADPPYVVAPKVKVVESKEEPTKKSKKRRRAPEDEGQKEEYLEVLSYKLPNPGPYPTDVVRRNTTRYTPAQIQAIQSGTYPGLSVIVGPPGTGKTDVATQIISNLYHNFPQERILMVTHSNQALNQLFEKITKLDIDERHLLRLGHGEERLNTTTSFSKQGRVESFLDNRTQLLAEVDRLAACLSAPGAHGDSCETAGYFNSVYVLPAWAKFEQFLADHPDATTEQIKEAYPFNDYFSNTPAPLFPSDLPPAAAIDAAHGGYRHISHIFAQLSTIEPFELLRSPHARQNYLLTSAARIIAMTSTHSAIRRSEISKLAFSYDTIILEESAQITEIETFIPLSLQKNPGNLKRIILLGDHLQNAPILQNQPLKQFAKLDQSLFERLIRLKVPHVTLDAQGRSRPEIAALYSFRYPKLSNIPTAPTFNAPPNPGFAHTFQFINVPDYKGQGETRPASNSIQNLGEAEYAVAVYMYMRLLGYPREKISILAAYAGQRELIADVIRRRCVNGGLQAMFGWPKTVTTVDRYQGEQNDYVILSLTRTKSIGYLRDMRRITVALSRARLGLYVLGRKDVFESCFELEEVVKRLCPKDRSEELELVTGEMYPGPPERGDNTQSVNMVSVEHIGKYVYEMTKTKLESMRGGSGETQEVEMEDA